MFYLASPYSHSDWQVREERYLKAVKALTHLLLQGRWTYSPIVHCHELAKMCALPGEHMFWKQYNEHMLLASKGLIVLQIAGWETSAGIRHEVNFAQQNGIPVEYLPVEYL
jgi:hypothetical protein